VAATKSTSLTSAARGSDPLTSGRIFFSAFSEGLTIKLQQMMLFPDDVAFKKGMSEHGRTRSPGYVLASGVFRYWDC
jgi:hypothetical protein